MIKAPSRILRRVSTFHSAEIIRVLHISIRKSSVQVLCSIPAALQIVLRRTKQSPSRHCARRGLVVRNCRFGFDGEGGKQLVFEFQSAQTLSSSPIAPPCAARSDCRWGRRVCCALSDEIHEIQLTNSYQQAVSKILTYVSIKFHNLIIQLRDIRGAGAVRKLPGSEPGLRTAMFLVSTRTAGTMPPKSRPAVFMRLWRVAARPSAEGLGGRDSSKFDDFDRRQRARGRARFESKASKSGSLRMESLQLSKSLRATCELS